MNLRRIFAPTVVATLFAILTAGCNRSGKPATPPPPPDTYGGHIVAAALAQIGVTTEYCPAYVSISYPMGDVPLDRGVCSDVVIRALRDAHGIDLQQLVHEDMRANFSAYPTHWGHTRPDRNIDHRRVLNLRVFFDRSGYALTLNPDAPLDPDAFQPGDIVTCTVPPNIPHVMIISHQSSRSSGLPLTIHNSTSRGTHQNDALAKFPLTGHYRLTEH